MPFRTCSKCGSIADTSFSGPDPWRCGRCLGGGLQYETVRNAPDTVPTKKRPHVPVRQSGRIELEAYAKALCADAESVGSPMVVCFEKDGLVKVFRSGSPCEGRKLARIAGEKLAGLD